MGSFEIVSPSFFDAASNAIVPRGPEPSGFHPKNRDVTMSRVDKEKLRELSFSQLEDAVLEAEHLLDSGYSRHGQWSLGQICRHCREVQEMSLHGLPRWMSLFAWLRPIYRMTLLPKILRGASPIGLPTAPWLVPRVEMDDREEVAAFRESVQRDPKGDHVDVAHVDLSRFIAPFPSINSRRDGYHLNFGRGTRHLKLIGN